MVGLMIIVSTGFLTLGIVLLLIGILISYQLHKQTQAIIANSYMTKQRLLELTEEVANIK